MKFYDLVVMCVQNLSRRKVRTMLTVTGVVVGTCAIVVMISIGVGMQKSQDEMMAGMGDLTIIEVNKYGQGKNGKEVILDDAAFAKIAQMDNVVIATPFYNPYNISIKMVGGKNNRYEMNMGNVVGVYPNALEAFGFEFLDGKTITDTSAPYSVVFGEKAAYQFRDTKRKRGFDRVNSWPDKNGKIKDPFVDVQKDKLMIRTEKQKDTAKEYTFEVAYSGRLKEDYGKGYETSGGAYMNIRDLKKIEQDYYKANGIKKPEDKGYDSGKVKVSDIKYVDEVEKAIAAMGYGTWSMESMRKPLQEQARQQQMVLGGLGAISLFVAAIGITNTMVMSIYERTREIGVMKVLGCFVGNIRTVFLMEAGSIGFMGGVIGIVLSYLISFMMNFFGFSMGGVGNMGGMGGTGTAVSIIPPWLVVAGLIFSTIIGLVAGFYPANRAVQISALEAIKTD